MKIQEGYQDLIEIVRFHVDSRILISAKNFQIALLFQFCLFS